MCGWGETLYGVAKTHKVKFQFSNNNNKLRPTKKKGKCESRNKKAHNGNSFRRGPIVELSRQTLQSNNYKSVQIL